MKTSARPDAGRGRRRRLDPARATSFPAPRGSSGPSTSRSRTRSGRRSPRSAARSTASSRSTGTTRADALEEAKQEAVEKAVAAGAERDSVRIVDVEEVPLAYLPSQRDPVPGQGGRGPRRSRGWALRPIAEEALEDIAVGAAILGTGGGGNPYIGKLLAQAGDRRVRAGRGRHRRRGRPTTPSPCFSAMMGAPTVMVEKIPRGTEADPRLRRARRATWAGGRRTRPRSEVGGVNSMLPIASPRHARDPARRRRRDGPGVPRDPDVHRDDLRRRATPMALADEKGNSAVIDTIDNRWAERLARSVTVEYGATALIALYPMSGAQARESLRPGHARARRGARPAGPGEGRGGSTRCSSGSAATGSSRGRSPTSSGGRWAACRGEATIEGIGG